MALTEKQIKQIGMMVSVMYAAHTRTASADTRSAYLLALSRYPFEEIQETLRDATCNPGDHVPTARELLDNIRMKRQRFEQDQRTEALLSYNPQIRFDPKKAAAKLVAQNKVIEQNKPHGAKQWAWDVLAAHEAGQTFGAYTLHWAQKVVEESL